MTHIRKRLPSPAMIVAIIALVAATAGTSYAAFGLGALSTSAKTKTVGVGKLTYVTTTTTDTSDGFTPTSFLNATATCPAGTVVIGGGIKAQRPDEDFIVDSYPTATGWVGRVFASGPVGTTSTFTTTAICAKSRQVTGAPPAS